MRKAAIAMLALISFCAAAVANDKFSGIGRSPAPGELANRMISVAPDGTGLPPGRGTAREGRAVYNAHCSACHGMRGEGIGDYPALVGGRDSLRSAQPLYAVGSYWPYATTVWDYINRAMPYQSPASLAPADVYSVTAYVLFLNGIVRESQALEAKALPRIVMPNRDGFIDDPRPDVIAQTP